MFILIQSLVYGFGNPLTKIAYESVTPLWCLTFRFAFAFVILVVIAGKGMMRELRAVHFSKYFPACFCMAMAYICCNLALNWTSATNVGFIMSMPVIFVPILEYFILQKPYRKRYLPIQGIVLVGLYLLCSNGGQFVFRTGDLLALATALMIAGALVYGEQSLNELSAVTVSAAQVGMTVVISLAAALAFDSLDVVKGIQPAGWGIIVYLAVACTCIAYILQNTALKHLKSTTVSLLQCTQPVVTALIAWLLLGESLTVTGILGGVIIVVCIIAGNRVVEGMQ